MSVLAAFDDAPQPKLADIDMWGTYTFFVCDLKSHDREREMKTLAEQREHRKSLGTIYNSWVTRK